MHFLACIYSFLLACDLCLVVAVDIVVLFQVRLSPQRPAAHPVLVVQTLVRATQDCLRCPVLLPGLRGRVWAGAATTERRNRVGTSQARH